MPAAAVIPAPIVYIIFAVVKKLVVGFRGFSSQGRSKWLLARLGALSLQGGRSCTCFFPDSLP